MSDFTEITATVTFAVNDQPVTEPVEVFLATPAGVDFVTLAQLFTANFKVQLLKNAAGLEAAIAATATDTQ